MICKEVSKKMKVRDLITYGKIVVKKYEGQEDFKEQIYKMKEDIKRMQNLSPSKLNKELSLKREQEAIKYYRQLGIEIKEIKPLKDPRKEVVKEMNKIAREMGM
tara:strand:- start:59 stop:370 length:312 start_codon:yes stop_codon:yes gene_type:complete